MTGFEFGDVILFPFPFTDHSATKQRPAVVVSSGAYHLRRPDLIMMAVTSQLHSAAFGDTPITEWQAAGLLKPSMPKPLVATVDQHLVRRKLGRLQHVDLEALRGTLRAILGSWISRG